MKTWMVIGIAAAVAFGVWLTYNTGYSAGAAETEAAWQKRESGELRAARETIDRLNKETREREARHQQALHAISGQHQKDLQHAEDQRKRDVAAARAGTIRLRDTGATCKGAGSSGAGAAVRAAGGRDATTGAELSREATGFLLELANEADALARQLSRAQDLAREYYRACH